MPPRRMPHHTVCFDVTGRTHQELIDEAERVLGIFAEGASYVYELRISPDVYESGTVRPLGWIGSVTARVGVPET